MRGETSFITKKSPVALFQALTIYYSMNNTHDLTLISSLDNMGSLSHTLS